MAQDKDLGRGAAPETSKRGFSDADVGFGAPSAGAAPAAKKTFTDADVGIEPPARGFGGWARDGAAWLTKGAISVPEAVVGLADIPTGGRVGKFLENEDGAIGFRPKQAKEMVNDWHSDAYKANQAKFSAADGIVDKAKVAIENPSLILGGVVESLPSMAAGGVAARGALSAAKAGYLGKGAAAGAETVKGAAIAGGVGEGAVMAGSQASAIRQETQDGELTAGQAGMAAGTGVIGGLLGYGGAKLAQHLGIGNVETMLAQGTKGLTKEHADTATTAATNQLTGELAKSIPRQVIEGALVEGVFEELPQSVTETVMQNLALDKPWTDGLDEAVVMGILTGGAMGAGAAGYHGYTAPTAKKQDPSQAGAAPAAPQGAPAAEQGPALALPAPTISVGADGQAMTATDRNARMQRIASGDVVDVTPVRETLRPSEAMGLRADAGGLEGAAALAVDSGASTAVQPQQYIDPADLPDAGSDAPYVPAPAQAAAQPAIQSFDYLSASPEDRARYDALIDAEAEEWENMRANAPMEAFASLDALDESDLQSFDQASNVTNEEFLRSMGASDEEINDAIATSNQSRGAQGGAAGASQTQANDAGSTGARAGQGQSTGQVTQPAQGIGARIAQLDAEAEAADAEARDWASRKYKANGKDLPEYAAQGGPADVGEANEQRRLKAIADAKGRAAAARTEAQALRDQGNAQAQQAAKAPAAIQAAPTPAPKPASVADLAAISRKQIPDMTDSELVALASSTAPTHSRYQKLQKAIQTRGLQAQAATNQGAKSNGAQTPQAQQASTQQPAAGAAAGQAVNRVPAATAAQAAGPAAQQGAVNGGTTTGNNGAQASQQGAAGSQEAIAAIAQEGNARREAERARKLEASERWTRMTTAERQAAATTAKGLNAIQKKNVHTKPWADLSEKVRASLLDVVAPVTATENKALKAQENTNSASKAVESIESKAVVATKSNRLSAWDEAAQDDNAATLNRVQELVDSGRMGLDEANATVERAIRASTIAGDKGIVADYLGEAVARKTGAAYNYASTIDQFDGLDGMSLKDARSEHAKRMAARDVQANAPESAKDGGKQDSAYSLPAGPIGDEWRDGQKRSPEHPEFTPTPRQQRLMNEVKKVLEGGAFYNDDVTAKVAKALGVSDEVLASNRTGVQGGDFGYDVYHARKALDAQAQEADASKIRAELNLQAGDKLGTLIFNDFKQTNAVEVVSISEDGRRASFKGKRGAATVTFEAPFPTVKFAIERAHERGKRKDSYEEFIAGRAAGKQPAKQPAAGSSRTAEIEVGSDGRITLIRREAGGRELAPKHFDSRAEAHAARIEWERGTEAAEKPLHLKESDLDRAAADGYKAGKSGVTTPPYEFESDEAKLAWSIGNRRGREESSMSESATDADLDAMFDEAVPTEPGEPIMVDGLRVSPTTVKLGDSVKPMWKAQSVENSERERRGERQLGGDSLHDTKEQAVAAAKAQAKDAKDKARASKEEAEAQKQQEQEKAAKKADTINGFTEGMAPNTAALAAKALDKLVRWRDKVASVREHIEAWHKAGELEVSTTQEPRIKPMSRTAFNRASQREQDAHEKRMKDAGSKTVYWVNDIDLGKTAHDYASHLLAQDDQAQAPSAAEVPEQPPVQAERSEYPFGKLEAADTDEFHGLRVRVLPEMTGDSAWEGEVGMVLKHGRLLEVLRDGRDLRVRVPGDRVEVLDPKAIATTPAARFEQLRTRGKAEYRANDREQAPFKAFGTVAGATGESYTTVWSRWSSAMGFMETVKSGTGGEVAAKMQAQLLKEPWANEAVYPGDGRGMAADASLQAWRNRADKVDKQAESFARELDREELRARDAENFGVPDDAVSKARAAVAEMRKRAAKAVQETKDGLAKAEERAKAEEAAEAKAYQDTFEVPSQSVLAKKPTPASITSWSNPTELRGQNFYTNGHIVDATGTAPHLKGWETRIGIRKDISPDQMDRVLGLAGVRNGAPDSSYVKAEPFALIDDKKNGRLFFDVDGKLVSIDLTYAQYFNSKVKGATFMVNPNDLDAAVRVMDGDKLAGILMPIRQSIYSQDKLTVEAIRGYMAASGKDKPQSIVARKQAEKVKELAAEQPAAASQAIESQQPEAATAEQFPMAESVQSYNGISHSGRSRAEGDKQAFDKFMESAQAAAEKLATTDAQREALAAAADSLRADYLQQYRSLMNVRAGTYSGFVAGRGNLNSKQADSRNNALDKAMQQFDGWVGDNVDRISKAVLDARTPEQVQADRAKVAAEIAAKKEKKITDLKAQLLKILSFKSGEDMPYGKSAVITRVSYDKDGYPSILNFKMADGSPVTDDKLDLVSTLKDKGETTAQAKARIRTLVDEVRAENPELTKGAGAIRASASSKAAQNKEKVAKVSADYLNGAVKGDTITASADFDYVTGGKPMVIEDISPKGEVHVVDPVRGGRTSFSASLAAARRITFEVKKAEPEQEPQSYLDRHNAIEDGISAGTLELADYKAAFADLEANQAQVIAELQKMTKEKLLRAGGPAFAYRMHDEKKDAIVQAAYSKMLDTYALGRSYGPSSYFLSASGIAKNKADKAQALRDMVANTTAEDLAARAAEIKAARDEYKAKREAAAQALENPKTLQDFRAFMRHWMEKGETSEAAYLRLTPEQRQNYDALEAEQTKDSREAAKRRAKVSVASAGNTTAGEVIATKHTKHGHDLFVVQLAERVERDAYETLNNSAKRLGGSYSSYRGGGAVPGFQFRNREAAEAFQKLVSGDTAQAQQLAEQRRDAFDDDKSQTAAERLRTMADALDERATEALGADRKVNTARRARFAASADAAARAQQALAGTMRNIAQAIDSGAAKFLDGVRQRVQVEYLMGQLRTAKSNQLQAKYPDYGERMKRQGEPIDAETVDFAQFPRFEMFRSDLAGLARQLLEIEGGKKMGAALEKLADDVTDAYTDWAKANLLRVSHFGNKVQGGFAEFASKDVADRAIKRAGLVGKAVVLPIKRGQNRVILSPGEAMQRGLWQGDGDKRIRLDMEFVEQLAQLGKRKGSKVLALPWQLESALENRQRLQRMGIQTPAEFRSALRELASLQQEMATPDRIKELERSMVGRANDGLDFFPTSPAVVQSMLDAAEISEGMAVLEPSAGMGHIADAIVAETGVWPDVVEISGQRRELLEAKGFHLAEVNDFLNMEPRRFFTYGDTFRAPDGVEGIMRGVGGMGSQRVRLEDAEGNRISSYYDRSELVPVAQNGSWSGYDRIIMNPPFSDGRDIQHVQHAYNLLRPGGRIVAIMGEGAFFQSNKRAEAFRNWLDERGATNEKLPDGSFMDPSLPVNTGVAARMVVIDKPVGDLQLAPRYGEDAANYADSDQGEASGDVRFNRGTKAPGQSMAAAQVQQVVDGMRKGWGNAPEIVVAQDMQDPAIPAEVRAADLRQRSGGAVGEPEGFYYKGKAYVIAGQMRSANDVARVVAHEVLGHAGLRGMFGTDLGRILDQLATMRRAEVAAKIKEYGLSDDAKGRREAAEEVLSVMAQTTPKLGFVTRAVAAIRTWLRANVPGFQSLRVSDAEIIRDYILPARAFVERGGPDGNGPRGGQRIEPAMSRAEAASATDSDNILFSRAKMAELKDKGLQMAHTYMTHPGKVSLWDKTVGTMRHISERYPAFKPVFEAAQQFIDDVASVANQAAQHAPRLIPRVETLSDLRKKPISVVDNRAIGKALFGGTLDWGRDQHGKAMLLDELKAKYAGLTVDQKAEVLLAAGKVRPQLMAAMRGKQLEQFESFINNRFDSTILKPGARFNHKELRDFFGLNDQQISLYDEARATVDKSLDITARAEMLRALGRDWDGFRDMVMDAPTLTDAWKLLDDELEQRAKAIPDSRDQMAAKMFQIRASHDKAQELMQHGYMPLQRFGKYTVDVVGADGERIYFGMFESKADSNRMAETMKREYQGASVTQGTLNEQQYKLFAGITPETAELFGSMLGLDAAGNDAKDQAFQEFLKLSKNNHSALKRLIHRKGIAGYSEDVGRVLASFVYSNARLAATGLNAGKMETAINDLNTKHKHEGELGEIAAKLREYIQDPQEEGQAIRGMLFAQYLGGSIASAMVNMTQPFAVTLPWLSQFGGMAKASRYLSGALKDMATRGFKYDSELAHALKMAEDDGVVSPQEIHQLMAQARGAGGLRTGDGTKTGDARANAANVWEKVKVGWGQPFALAEQFNRRSTFIAAYRLAKEQGKDNPAEFARRAVVETQFLYTKANKPQWARGAIGGTLFTFKTYSVSFLELMQRTWNAGEAGSPERAAGRRAVGWAMLMLMLMGGAGGLPFVEDVEDLVDGAGQMMGYNTSVKQWRQQAMRDVLGSELADFLESGLSGLPGMPLDVSGRLGMGNLIPGTGLLLDKQSNARDVVELLGPAGDLVQRGLEGTKEIIKGAINADGAQMVRGAGQWAPTAVRNAAKGADMAVSGMYKDSKGYKVIDTTLDEAILKAIGFQPRSVAEVQESNSFMQRSKSFYIQTSSDIKAKWAQALFEKDTAGVERARERVQEWNRKNPDQPIRINMPDIWKRVAQMGKDRTDRIADTAPKALRQQLRDMAQEQSR